MTTETQIAEIKYSASQLDLVKRTFAKDCNNDEFNLYVETAKRKGLDILSGHIIAQVYNKDKPEKER
jgi:hypothetical protein